MAIRVVNGNTKTEDGWPLVDQAGCTWIHIPGCVPPVTIQVQTGIPATILGAWTADLNAFVQKVRDRDTASWTEGNSVLGQPGRNNGSNHLGGTAEDVDWDDHPMGPMYAGWNADQIAEIRRMREFYKLPDGTYLVFWAEDWDVPHDSMHFQMGYNTFERQDAIHAWCAQNIRADGFSTYRRGNAPMTPPAAQVLADATGLTIDRAGVILPTVISGLQASQCNNVNRIAMWLAQCGEESAGFSTTTEFASGAEYEGRCSDLGNCSPGDGVKYKGRTWIQITGKAHYREFSQWAFDKGLCSSPTQFVDNPASLGDLPWAGIGAAWYWTVSRPDINALSDAGDVVTVTHRINGGEHGLADRQSRYARAHGLGDQLLTLTSPTQGDDMAQVPQDQWDRVYRELTQLLPSRSPLRYLDQAAHYKDGLVDTWAGLTMNLDGMTHVQFVEVLAGYNHPPTMALLTELANGDPAKYPDRADDIKLAQAILNRVAMNKIRAAAPAATGTPTVVNNTAVLSRGDVQQIADAAANAVAAQQPTLGTVQASGTKGQLFGNALDALEALQSVLTPQGKATVVALIGALQTEEVSA